jgi:hypothetical protein
MNNDEEKSKEYYSKTGITAFYKLIAINKNVFSKE